MIHIFGGGTLNYVRSHFEISAYAQGSTAKQLHEDFSALGLPSTLHLTAFADPRSELLTVDSVRTRLLSVLEQPETKAIVFSVAIADFMGQVGDIPSAHHATRLKSREGILQMTLSPTPKILPLIQQLRPDVLSVGFKTTASVTREETIQLARRQIAETGMHYVFANDIVNRFNALVSSKEHFEGETRESVVQQLVAKLAERLK